jgi:predicted metal-dependent hydrolase
MENKFLVLFCVAIACLFPAECSAATVFEILASKMDILFFNIKKMKSDIDEINESALEVKQLFESYKAEMNEKFTSLEEKVTERVDELVQQKVLVLLNGTINENLSEADNERSKESIKNITDKFEIRIQNAEQSVAVFTKDSAIRMKEVENKMFAFENGEYYIDVQFQFYPLSYVI